MRGRISRREYALITLVIVLISYAFAFAIGFVSAVSDGDVHNAGVLGLAVGLGGKEVAGGILAGYYTRQRLHAGDMVTVAGFEGTVREVGPVATIIETREDGLTSRHSVPNTKMLSDAVR
jgi:small-conductance mechanosensitive channel